jgi:archaemetzincin
MIRLVTISDLPDLVVTAVCRRLFTTFGVGAEPTERRAPPPGEILDAARFLQTQRPASAFADDQTLFLTDAPVSLPSGPLGAAPTGGYADPATGLAVVTTDGLKLPPAGAGEEDEQAWLAYADRVARRAVHQIGFLWGLHRCVDARCAMSPPWVGDPPPALCDFCRDRTDTRVQRARS